MLFVLVALQRYCFVEFLKVSESILNQLEAGAGVLRRN